MKKKILYILLLVVTFFIGWESSDYYHRGLNTILLNKIALFQSELDNDRWIIEKYRDEYVKQRMFEDSLKMDSLRRDSIRLDSMKNIKIKK